MKKLVLIVLLCVGLMACDNNNNSNNNNKEGNSDTRPTHTRVVEEDITEEEASVVEVVEEAEPEFVYVEREDVEGDGFFSYVYSMQHIFSKVVENRVSTVVNTGQMNNEVSKEDTREIGYLTIHLDRNDAVNFEIGVTQANTQDAHFIFKTYQGGNTIRTIIEFRDFTSVADIDKLDELTEKEIEFIDIFLMKPIDEFNKYYYLVE